MTFSPPSAPAFDTTVAAVTAAAAAEDVVKDFGAGPTAVRALEHVSVELTRGEFTAVMGPSGSGKSTPEAAPVGGNRPGRHTVEP
jgi:putative ABC transport system ATP-binding protein